MLGAVAAREGAVAIARSLLVEWYVFAVINLRIRGIDLKGYVAC